MIHAPEQLRRFRRRIDRALEAFVGLLMALLVLNVLWQVVTRFVLHRPSSVTEEIARYGLIWLGVFGAALAFRRGLHPSLLEAMATLAGRRGPALREHLARGAHAAVALFGSVVLIYGGVRLVALTRELGQRSAALGLPLAWIYLAVPLAGALITFYALSELLLQPQGRPLHDVEAGEPEERR